MGIFSRSKSKPTFTSYSEKHFREGVHRVLWQDEKLLADGFFEDGPDPIGVEDVMKGMFGGNSHTYLAVTNWRVILGYLANGGFSSHEYVDTEPMVRKSGAQFYFTYSNPVLKASNSPNFRSTYNVSKEVVEAIEQNLASVTPTRLEVTQINLSKKSWGEGPLAELAKKKSGRDYMLVEVCSACSGTMLVPDDIQSAPEKGNRQCQTCLRVKGS